MSRNARARPTPEGEFRADAELGYVKSRTSFRPGEGLALDEAYRRAHLPLIAPDHPRRIGLDEARGYAMGRHQRIWSLVAPIPATALDAAPAYRALDADLQAASFAGKIAWDLLPRRRDRLHATICGSLGIGEEPPRLDVARRALAGLDPVQVELRGMFSGNVNIGRLYLRLYPRQRAGEDALALIQRTLGRPETGLYLVGVWNLVDDLDAAQAADLARLIELWWDRPVLRLAIDALWLLGACDDLVLDARIGETIALLGRRDRRPVNGA